MCMAQFFGELSPFEVIVAIVAFGTGIYTFYKSFFERAKICVFPGDQIRFVIYSNGPSSKFQLLCNIVNESVKVGTVHRLESILRSPANSIHEFVWNLFFKYLPGGAAVQKESDPYPISIDGKNSSPKFMEFRLLSSQSMPEWQAGKYDVVIRGWVNKRNRNKKPNLRSRFSFNLSQETCERLNKEKPSTPQLVAVPINEWNK